MIRVMIYAAAALAIAAATWFLIATPRIELAELSHTTAAAKVTELLQLDVQRVETIEKQQAQLTAVTENELRNRELLQTIAGQSRAQSRALQELKQNDETISEYLRSAVPADLGRLYQRTTTTNPRDYRQSSVVQSDTVSTAGASTATGE